MKNITSHTFLLFFLFAFPAQSIAWGALGHRIVGEIADTYLTAKTKKEIEKILGHESVAMSSTWMDFVRSDNSYRYLGEWHYINFEQGLTYLEIKQKLKADTGVNVYTKINFVTKELKKKTTSLALKKMYLRILIHLVGDVHQPMHCGRAADSGGNDIRVTWFNKSINLHSLWDSELIEFQQLSYTEYAKAINYASAVQLKTWQKDVVSKWVFESYELSADLYKKAEANHKYMFKYNYDYIDTLNEQLLKAGVRLGGLLNKIFEVSV